jgi:hypothetical protein
MKKIYDNEGILSLALRAHIHAFSTLCIQLEKKYPAYSGKILKFVIKLNITSSKLQSRYHVDSLLDRGVGNEYQFKKLKQKKSSDTIFVLGSGNSINDISDKGWEYINSNDSIGLNRWPIYDHVPTFYVYETPGNRNREFREVFYKLLQYKEDEYQDVPVIVKSVNRTEKFLDKKDMPKWVAEDAYLSKDTSLPDLPNTKEMYRWVMTYLINNDYYIANSEPEMYYHNRGSISYIIHLLVSLDYVNIVLCGVDMVNSKYFFDDKKYMNSEIPIPISESVNRGDVHRTVDENIAEVTLEDVIYTLNSEVLKREGINLYVENTISALHPKIPRIDYVDQ